LAAAGLAREAEERGRGRVPEQVPDGCRSWAVVAVATKIRRGRRARFRARRTCGRAARTAVATAAAAALATTESDLHKPELHDIQHLATYVGENPCSRTTVGHYRFDARVQVLEGFPHVPADQQYIMLPMWCNHVDEDQKLALFPGEDLRPVILPGFKFLPGHKRPAYEPARESSDIPVQAVLLVLKSRY
jgi:hypothetical protein